MVRKCCWARMGFFSFWFLFLAFVTHFLGRVRGFSLLWVYKRWADTRCFQSWSAMEGGCCSRRDVEKLVLLFCRSVFFYFRFFIMMLCVVCWCFFRRTIFLEKFILPSCTTSPTSCHSHGVICTLNRFTMDFHFDTRLPSRGRTNVVHTVHSKNDLRTYTNA